MPKGFKRVVTVLIRENPGLTSGEYAQIALQRHLCASDSRDPVFSLATTLAKEYREGRMPGIEARKIDGSLRYYPAGHAASGEGVLTKNEVAVSLSLPSSVIQTVDTLLELGKFNSRSAVLAWLIEEGIRARSHELQQAEAVAREIRRLKQSVEMNPGC